MTARIDRHLTRVLGGLLLASLLAGTAARAASDFGARGEPAAQQTPAAGAEGSKPKKNPLLKLAQPWPSAEELRRHKDEAEARALFSSADPIAFTLVGDFKTINKDHDPKSAKRYPGELRVARPDGRTDAIPVQLSARGHVRRMAQTCDFVPLRVEFSKELVKDTLFDGQTTLKLVVQCRTTGEYEQYVLREYLAYRIFNLLSPRSLKARLAKVTYVDSTTDKAMGTRYGMFLEHDSDLARRMEGRTVEIPRAVFKDVDADALETMMIFAYMIGHTDFSIYALHNVILVQTPDRMLHTIPYDFDISGLVHPPYAIPGRGLPIKTVQERFFRGPCRTQDQVEPILANFNSKKASVLGLLDTIPGIDRTSRQDARAFLDGFYSTITNQGDVKRLFVEKCSKAPGM